MPEFGSGTDEGPPLNVSPCVEYQSTVPSRIEYASSLDHRCKAANELRHRWNWWIGAAFLSTIVIAIEEIKVVVAVALAGI